MRVALYGRLLYYAVLSVLRCVYLNVLINKKQTKFSSGHATPSDRAATEKN